MASEMDEGVDDELDEADLDDLSEDDLEEEDLVEDDEDLVEDLVEEEEEDHPLKPTSRARTVSESDEVGDDDEDELDDDDVEASLDVILKERLVVEDEEEEDEEETAEIDDRGDGAGRVLPKQPGEFVCQSCFLVKSQSQLADRTRMLCRDCV